MFILLPFISDKPSHRLSAIRVRLKAKKGSSSVSILTGAH
jgi:hypothetical protein